MRSSRFSPFRSSCLSNERECRFNLRIGRLFTLASSDKLTYMASSRSQTRDKSVDCAWSLRQCLESNLESGQTRQMKNPRIEQRLASFSSLPNMSPMVQSRDQIFANPLQGQKLLQDYVYVLLPCESINFLAYTMGPIRQAVFLTCDI